MPAPASNAPAAGHALAVSDVSTGYRGVPVVRELTLQVHPGEVVALLGPNGAGKTTTLETIAGLNRPLSGTIELSGENIAGKPAHLIARKGLALVPEGRALFPGLTVREHLRVATGRSGRGRTSGRAEREGQNAQAGQETQSGRGGGEDELLEMLPELRKCLKRQA